MGLVARGE